MSQSASISSAALSSAYGSVAVVFHWAMALMIVAIFGLGLFMSNVPLSPEKLRYYAWHKWAGASVFLLAALRLLWSLTHPVAMSAPVPAWKQAMAKWTHRMFYVLMLAIPVSGWLMSSAKGVPTVYLGLWRLPDLVRRDPELGTLLQGLHGFLNYTMASMLVIHVAAALKHHLWDKDEVLVRMLPFLRTPQWRQS